MTTKLEGEGGGYVRAVVVGQLERPFLRLPLAINLALRYKVFQWELLWIWEKEHSKHEMENAVCGSGSRLWIVIFVAFLSLGFF